MSSMSAIMKGEILRKLNSEKDKNIFISIFEENKIDKINTDNNTSNKDLGND